MPTKAAPEYAPRPGVIRTFHPRRGRMSTTAADAIERLWARRGFDIDETHPNQLDQTALFGRLGPLVLEIGCGMGEALLGMAAADPDRDYLGVDVHTPGLGAILAQADAQRLDNIAVARGDAVELLNHGVARDSLEAIHVFFPDPWPKARHHKRRLIRPEIVALMADRLRPGGALHIATDWPHYAEQIDEVLRAEIRLRSTVTPNRPETKFERRGLAAGRSIHDFACARVDATASVA